MIYKKADGFTLLEVTIAMAILSIGILGIAGMQISAMNGNRNAGNITSNATWAVSRIEDLMTLAYTDTDLAAGAHTPSMDTDGIDNNSNGFVDEANESGNLSISWNVVDDTPVTRSKTVTVSLTRTGPGGTKTVSLTQVIPEIL
jgi:prepilin-type N-terminal cleavage/methylation domain-containing protein